jgi:DNA-binding transcriptional regulator LsrR (DeoR family)/transcriptional regulator with XRE-family HTH domain
MASIEEENEIAKKALGERLGYYRVAIEGEVSQADLGELIGREGSDINRWENGRSAPQLRDFEKMRLAEDKGLGNLFVQRILGVSGEYHHDGISWRELPLGDGDFSPGQMLQKERVERGIKFFRRMVCDKQDLHTATGEMKASTVMELFTDCELALQLGALRITEVPTNSAMAKQVKVKFQEPGINLETVIVANVPLHDGRPIEQDIDGTPIRAEIVASLAAKAIFSNLRADSTTPIAVGSGFTVARVGQHSATYGLVNNAHWIPLIGYTPDRPIRYAANSNAALSMAVHPGSTAKSLGWQEPFNFEQEFLKTRSRPAIIIVTVNGFASDIRNPRQRDENYNSAVDGYSGTQHNSPKWLYEQMRLIGKESMIAGELLGVLLDDNAKPVLQGEMLAQSAQFSQQMHYELLRVFRSQVWLVASMQFKARAVLMAIRNGLASNIVIDASIAEYLLKHG